MNLIGFKKIQNYGKMISALDMWLQHHISSPSTCIFQAQIKPKGKIEVEPELGSKLTFNFERQEKKNKRTNLREKVTRGCP
jgi:hypothetical protein